MNKKFFTLFCLFAVAAGFTAHAQGWERAYPTLSSQLEATALRAIAHPGGSGLLVLMTDYQFSVGDFYLVALDDTGAVQNVQTFDFGGAEAAVDFIATSDGGFAVLYDVFYDPLDTIATHLLRLDAGFNTVFDVSLPTVAGADFYRGLRVLENTNGLFVFGNNRTPDGYEWATTLGFTAAGGFTGQLDWGPQNSPLRDAIAASDGTLIGLTDHPGAVVGNGDRIRVTRLDAAGAVVLWEKLLISAAPWERAGALENALDGNLMVGGSRTGDAILYKVDLQGNVLWESQPASSAAVWGIFDLAATPDGGYWAVGQTPTFIPQIYLMRFDAAGQFVRSALLGRYFWYNNPYHALALPDNGALLSGSHSNGAGPFPAPMDPYLWRADSLGRTFATGVSGRVQVDLDGDCIADDDSLGYGPYTVFALQNGVHIDSVEVNAAGFFDLGLPAGAYQLTVQRPSTAWSLCVDTLSFTVAAGQIADNQDFVLYYDPQRIDTVYGFVFIDYDGDCIKDAFEPGLEEADVQFVLGHPDATVQPAFSLFLLSDANGAFSTTATQNATDLLESFAQINPTPANPQQCVLACKNVDYIETPGSRVYSVMFGMQCQPLPPCPVMETQIATPSLRPCFPSAYTVQVCNYGAVMATDASVDVSFDPALQITGASLPWTAINGSTYTFELADTLLTGACINFTIDVFVPCDEPTGKTYCAEAHAYPDTSCDTPPANWDGAEIAVSAACVDTTVVFTIGNVGTGNMAAPLDYIVIEDNVLLMQQPGNFQLNAGEQLTLPFEPQGSFLRLEADQSPGFPGLSLPVAWVEGCGAGSVNPPSYGFVNQYPVDDPEPWLDVFCLQSTNSYDPNDKTGFPLGYGAERYIEVGQPLEYLIRFQNTGTAPAVNVEIRDTLPWQWLDPTTVRPGPSSHPYQFDIQGNGVVVFKFPGINLPDSVANEPESHGFVTFTIEQKPGVPLETPVFNSAAIYFDFNAPVITNQTLHTVGKNFILVETDEPGPAATARVTAAPNPAMDRVRFAVAGVPDGQEISVTLFSALGRPVRTVAGPAAGHDVLLTDLTAGVYWFEVRSAGNVIGKGKLVKVGR